ncbi:hypothetical protein GOP47_0007944 [Adiantum capillus-veneris]|uniref:Uncharacterized protein n=1 Tax=Adiantum capillus-veneris TaxID=13818 RepID=A0A9D4V1N5_ADICA|nr:hypothetical protein GOP47_0007944 [Adiantum capillus-veneris]
MAPLLKTLPKNEALESPYLDVLSNGGHRLLYEVVDVGLSSNTSSPINNLRPDGLKFLQQIFLLHLNFHFFVDELLRDVLYGHKSHLLACEQLHSKVIYKLLKDFPACDKVSFAIYLNENTNSIIINVAANAALCSDMGGLLLCAGLQALSCELGTLLPHRNPHHLFQERACNSSYQCRSPHVAV